MSKRAYLLLCVALCLAIAACIGAILWMLNDMPPMRVPDYTGAQLVWEVSDHAAV